MFGYSLGEPESGMPDHGLGYIPQELGLDECLTIEDLSRYFESLL